MPRSRLLLAALVTVAACSSAATGAEPGEMTTPPSTTTPSTTAATAPSPPPTAETTTTTSVATSPTTLPQPVEELLYEHWRGSFRYGADLRIDVHAPAERSVRPIAVLVHGGGWFGGRLDSMGYLADGLAERGFVVFNATYRTIAQGGAFPGTVEDVACAVAYARAHALDYSTSADHVTLIGHSAGAHLSALVALAPGVFGTACEGGTEPLDAWVGLAGPYDTDTYAFLLPRFFGSTLTADPDTWRSGNPFTYVEASGAGPQLLLVHGDADELVPLTMSENFFLALDRAGAAVSLRVVPGAGHGEVNSPRIVGDLIADFVAGQ
ncbi:MAG TPA: alpha/beta hydrolase [Acidimicrobiia bacterium]|nr:alpha/beta hydrolase [Acidimicrobiia bacterium]